MKNAALYYTAALLIALGLLFGWMRERLEDAAARPPGHIPDRRHFDRRGNGDAKWLGPERRKQKRRHDDE